MHIGIIVDLYETSFQERQRNLVREQKLHAHQGILRIQTHNGMDDTLTLRARLSGGKSWKAPGRPLGRLTKQWTISEMGASGLCKHRVTCQETAWL